ncbi:MAG: ATP-binding cassette domain-containing protein [Burkholderiaceae bacterium]
MSEVESAASATGLEVSYRHVAIGDLAAADMPCVLMEKSGATWILVGRASEQTFAVWQGGETVEVAAGELAERASGVVFFVAPKARSEAESTPLHASPRSLIGLILDELKAKHRTALGQLALASTLSNLLMLAVPIYSMSVYDRVIPHLAMETLWALSIGVCLALMIDYGLRYVRLKLSGSVALLVSVTLLNRLYGTMLRSKMGKTPLGGGVVAQSARDIEGLCHLVPALVISVMIDLPWFLAALVLLYGLAGWVILAPVLGALALAAITWLPVVRRDDVEQAPRLSMAQAGTMLETATLLETAKTTNAERLLLRRWDRLTDAAAVASHAQRLQGQLTGQGAIVVGQICIVLALVIGVFEIKANAISVGALAAATLLVGRMIAPAAQAISLFHRLTEARRSTRAVEQIMQAEIESGGDTTRPPAIRLRGEIELREVSFSYPGAEISSLSGLSLRIKPGERVGLIGRVGSGKSSLLRLLVRLSDPTTGTISIDGVNASQLRPQDIRSQFAFMKQDTLLFDDTLKANICFGLDQVDERDFERAVRISGVADFAAHHPHGYGMRVGPRGERLSGGERQAVALARALVGDPSALLLDEPTAAMDNALEARIVQQLATMIAGRTFVIATHRAPLLALVDRLILLERGRIIADGPKIEVMKLLNQAAA